MKKEKVSPGTYHNLLLGIADLLQEARRDSARCVNVILTATYWEIGRRIVEFEQKGTKRAQYGEELLKQLSIDLQDKFGRGFTERNLRNMRQFYLYWPALFVKRHAVSAKSLEVKNRHLMSAKLSWTHYRRLLAVDDTNGRDFYEKEAVRGRLVSKTA